MTKSNKNNVVVEEEVVLDFTTMNPDEIFEHFGNISKSIRGLNKLEYSRGEIAKMLNKRYQHVRNVLITPLTGK